jgi:hypothetical protein
MQAQRFHYRPGTQMPADSEELLERAIGELNATIRIEQEQSFSHTVKQGFLPVLRLCGLLLLSLLELLEVAPGGHLQGTEFGAPPQVNEQ